MMILIAKTYYYVHAIFGSGAIMIGHTESQWLARQFASSIYNNKFFLSSYETEQEAQRNVTMVSYKGSLNDFYQAVKCQFGVYITGEDIIGTFEVGMGMPFSVRPCSDSVVSTCANVLGDEGFLAYAQRFLMPKDIMRVNKLVEWYSVILGLLRMDILDTEQINILIMFLRKLSSIPLFSANEPFINIGNFPTDTDFDFDVVRYGIWKGWYTAL